MCMYVPCTNLFSIVMAKGLNSAINGQSNQLLCVSSKSMKTVIWTNRMLLASSFGPFQGPDTL